MGAERRDGIGPNHFTFTIEEIAKESQLNPNKSPYVFLARHIGQEGRKKLKEVDRILVKEGLPGVPLYPGSATYSELAPREKEEFLVGYGAVGLAAIIEALFDAKNTHSFDFNLLAAIYNERVLGTSVITMDGRRQSVALDGGRLRRLLDQEPSGVFIFADSGMSLVDGLRSLLLTTDLLPIIRSKTLRVYTNFAEGLQLELRKRPLSIPQTAQIARGMPIPGDDRNLPPHKEEAYLKRLKELLG